MSIEQNNKYIDRKSIEDKNCSKRVRDGGSLMQFLL